MPDSVASSVAQPAATAIDSERREKSPVPEEKKNPYPVTQPQLARQLTS